MASDGAATAEANGPTEDAGNAAAASLRVAERVIAAAVLPASMLVPANAPLVSEVWCLLSLLPYRTRFRLYGEARDAVAAPERHPLLAAASRLAAYETRRVLKRLARPERDEGGRERRETKEAMRPYARMLAKSALATPLAVMDVLIQLVESYSNQIEPIVDALKFMSPLSMDVLTYTILYRLSVERDKVKEDGFTIADWLQNLSMFNAAACQKYSSMEMSAVCQLLANQLRAGDSFDLLVLKELIEAMTGITINSEVSDKQLDGLSGGPELQDRAIVRTSEEREKSSRAWSRSSRRLLAALQRGTPRQHLALPLYVLIAQQRHIVTAAAEGKHVKLIAEMFDKCQETARQYVCFLQKALSEDDYAHLLPAINVQRLQYNLDPEIVYCAFRPTLKRLLFVTSPLPEEAELEEGEEAPAPAGAPPAVGSAPEPEVAGMTWSRVLASMRASIPHPGFWDMLSPEVYATFWTLDISDIYAPTRRYQEEIAVVDAELSGVERQVSQARASSSYAVAGGGMGGGMYMGAGPAAGSTDELDRLKKLRGTLQDLASKLKSEMEAQQKHCRGVRARLDRDKGQLFAKTPKTRNTLLYQECILPRLLFSPEDALFSAKFLELLHELDTPAFATLMVYNEVFKSIVVVLKCITVREGSNMGIFLKAALRQLMHWRSSAKVYEEECHPKLGFLISINQVDGKKTTYDQFCKLMYKWHRDLFSITATCLQNEEWTSRRNALAVLTSVVEHFPVVSDHFKQVAKHVEELRDKEQREDLKKLAQGYLNLLDKEKMKPNRNLPAMSWGGPEPKKAPVRAPGAKATPASPAKAAVASRDPGTAVGAATKGNPSAASSAALRPDARAFQPKGGAGSVGAAAAAASVLASAADSRDSKEDAGAGATGKGGVALKREAPAAEAGVGHKRARHGEDSGGGGSGGGSGAGGVVANGADGRGEREGKERGEREHRDGDKEREREGKDGRDTGDKERDRGDKRAIKVERRADDGGGKDKEAATGAARPAAAAAERRDGDAADGHAHDGKDRERDKERDGRGDSRGRDRDRDGDAGGKADRKRAAAAEAVAAEASPSRKERREVSTAREAEAHEAAGSKRRRADVGSADLRQTLTRGKHADAAAEAPAPAAAAPERGTRSARRETTEDSAPSGRAARNHADAAEAAAPEPAPAKPSRRGYK